MSRAKQIVPAALVAIVAIAAGILLSWAVLERSSAPTLAQATLIDPPRALPPMAFIDEQGQPFGPERLRGRWSILFFGFTYCPDICPTTLALLAQVEKQLADLPAEQRPQIVLVSVDPKRDTPEVVQPHFHRHHRRAGRGPRVRLEDGRAGGDLAAAGRQLHRRSLRGDLRHRPERSVAGHLLHAAPGRRDRRRLSQHRRGFAALVIRHS